MNELDHDPAGVEILRASLAVRDGARRLVGADAREVAFLRVTDGGKVGFGECAPLVGLHRETLDEAIDALERWADGAVEPDAMPPSAAFAATCAIATLEGFGSRPAGDVEVAAFFAGGVDELDADAAAALAASGARTLKLKIGRAGAEAERALVARVLELLPGARLRLDGNRRLSEDDCLARLRGFDASRFEYLEDPLEDPSRLASLAARSGIAIALDETVLDRSGAAGALRDELARAGCVAAWVLRLSVLGPLARTRALAQEAEARGAKAVLSTAYESSYALRLAAHLAATLPNGRCAHGLGTAALLAEDSCAPAMPVAGAIAADPLPVPFVEAWS